VSAGVPAGPLESDPGGFVPQAERAAILAGVLDGAEPGAWDGQVARWLAGLDTSTLVRVASWIARSRAVARAQGSVCPAAGDTAAATIGRGLGL
jgi:hypothetical protein